jgi:pterin-4a-carbinolamine dehydratase
MSKIEPYAGFGVAELAEAEGHNTDSDGICHSLFATKTTKGLHKNDSIMAAKIDELTKR